jgi:hypothetical protein
VLTSRAVTALAIDPKVLPSRVISELLQIKILLAPAYMAGVTRFVPDWNCVPGRLLRVVDVKIVNPLLANGVPSRRK